MGPGPQKWTPNDPPNCPWLIWVCPVILEIKQVRLPECTLLCRSLWIMIMNDSVTKVCNELITEFVAFHCAQTLHNLIGIHSVHRLPLTYTCHYSSYLIVSGSLFPSGMAEVFVVTWIAYFSLVLIVSKLSLHKARFASISNPHIVCMSHIMLIYCIYFKVGTSWEFRKIFLIARRREVSLMDQSLVVCLLTSGIASLIFL